MGSVDGDEYSENGNTPNVMDCVEEDSDASSEEKLEGFPIRRPCDRRAKEDEEDGDIEASAQQAVTLTPAGLKLQKLKIFSSFSTRALQAIESVLEERSYAKDSCIGYEGERQPWLGVIDSGSASVSITSENNTPMGTLAEGDAFGELALLDVHAARTSTIQAIEDTSVLIVFGTVLWEVLLDFENEREQLFVEVDRWRAFLSCRLFAGSHLEVVYTIRKKSASRVVVCDEKIELGCRFHGQEQSSNFAGATAVVEFGCLSVAEDGDGEAAEAAEERGSSGSIFGPGAVVNDFGVLGVPRIVRVTSHPGSCGITLISRSVFWSVVENLASEKERFTRLALERLPPSTFDVGGCDFLAYLQGTTSLSRTVQSHARQRVCVPGSLVSRAGEACDVLRILQQGAVGFVHKGYQIHVLDYTDGGCYMGEMNFLGLVATCQTTIVALDLCVLQEIRRQDLEHHFARHQSVRSRMRELVKLKASMRNDTSVQAQVHGLQEIPFFAPMAEDFLRDLLPDLEHWIYLPRQVINSPETSGDFMTIINVGQCIRKVDGVYVDSYGPGCVIGDVSMLCDSRDGVLPRETLIAETVSYVQHLHRKLLAETLKIHPEEGTHFEKIVRQYAQQYMSAARGNNDREEGISNIYTLPFFKNCGSRFLYLLDLHLERHVYFCDQEIIQEGTEGEDMFILYGGVARIVVKGIKVALVHEGECIGEMAVLGLVKKRTATIAAQSVCDVRILSRKSLEEAIREFPEELEPFESLSARRQRITHERQYGSRVTQTSRFFKGCCAEFAACLIDCMEDKLYRKGQVIMSEGDKGDWMVLIHQGQCEVIFNGEQVAVLGSGDIIGEMAVLGIASTRTATVRALDVCFAQVLYREQLLPVAEKFPTERAQLRLLAAHRMQDRVTTTDTVRVLNIWKDSSMGLTEYLDKRIDRWVFFLGDELIQQGARGDHLFLVMSGSMQVFVDDVNVGSVETGDVVGEMAVLGIVERRSASVRCTELSDVYTLRRGDLNAALQFWPEQEGRLRNIAAKRLRNDIERTHPSGFLQTCPLFEKSSQKFIQCISSHFEDRILMQDEVLCYQGDPGDAMFVLLRGMLIVEINGEQVQEVSEGSVFGEIAVLGLSTERTATLRSKNVCLVQVLHRSNLMKYLAEFPREMIHFQEIGAERLAKGGSAIDTSIFQRQCLFKDCGIEFMQQVCERLQRKFYFASQKIVKEGNESHEMFVILMGEVVVERRGTIVRVLGEGLSFGAMAVLGINTAQTLTVKAESLVDMHVLNRWPLEELLVEYPEERKRLLSIMATIMREDFAGVTNSLILSEVGMLQSLHDTMLERLSSEMRVDVCRKDELAAEENEKSLIVILQGSAALEIGGVTFRELTVGDHYGTAQLIGASEMSNITIRATATCLFMKLDTDAFFRGLEHFPKTLKNFKDMTTKLTRASVDMRVAALASAPVIQHLQITRDESKELLEYCEECIFQPMEEILAGPLRRSTLLVVVNGEARIGNPPDRHGILASADKDKNGVVLKQGCAIGELSKEAASEETNTAIVAATLCKVLMLHRSVFLEWARTRPEDAYNALLSRLGDMPRKHTILGGSNLRQFSDSMTANCIKAAKLSLNAHQKVATELGGKSKLKGWALAAASIRGLNNITMPFTNRARIEEPDAAAGKNREVAATPLPVNRKRSKLSVVSETRRSLAQIQRETLENSVALEERLLRLELQRLVTTTQGVTAAAKCQERQLHEEALALRARLQSMVDAATRENTADGPARVPSPRRGIAALKSKLKAAYARRAQLLKELELVPARC